MAKIKDELKFYADLLMEELGEYDWTDSSYSRILEIWGAYYAISKLLDYDGIPYSPKRHEVRRFAEECGVTFLDEDETFF